MKWISMTKEPLRIYGLAVKEEGKFQRLPDEIIDKVNERVTTLALDSAGGRVRFRTDSPTIAVRHAVSKLPLGWANLGMHGKSGVDVYVDGVFHGGRATSFETTLLEASVAKDPKMQDVDLYLPTYNHVLFLEVGLEDGAAVEPARPYTIEKPIVFYGSSITQGAASSRPGINYVARVARALDADFINLGFAGAARGEEIMARYIAGLDMSLFVYDYDHNAFNAEHLAQTHEPFFRIIREAQPDLPVLMLSKPDFDGNYSAASREVSARRRDIIRATWEHAKDAGDKWVWFLDGETLFGTEDRDSCTADACHPNDLGFARMAQAVIPVVKEILYAAQQG